MCSGLPVLSLPRLSVFLGAIWAASPTFVRLIRAVSVKTEFLTAFPVLRRTYALELSVLFLGESGFFTLAKIVPLAAFLAPAV